jgi:outer membrane protein assembly factor BamB
MDKSMLGPPITVLTLPLTVAAFSIALILLSRVLSIRRTIVALVTAFLAASFSALLKNDGARGDFSFGLDWRWRPTPEEVFLANRNPVRPNIPKPTAESLSNPQWPGFRGPNRDGIQRGMKFESDWNKHPPKELWRIKLGPAWSSFAVAGGFLFTQEQRGDQEAIVCYDADTGTEVWVQEIKSRFFDGLGGLGPRATPMIADGSVFAMGAEGWLIKLNAIDGSIIWQVDLREITKLPPPMWGFSCSPLVVEDLVFIHAAGKHDKGIIAFDIETGDIRWSVPADKDSYSSLHLTNYFGRQQLVFLGADGATFLDPATGQTLLKPDFRIVGYRALQPAAVDTNHLLFTSEYSGSRLIELKALEQKLESKEVWTSRGIKPDFNDLVVHAGFAYGFDGAIFTCIDLKDGSRCWRKGRYGKGQVLLLSDSALLLVISEDGQLVLLSANPEEHRELAKLKALEGKTWNHPVVVGNRLYLRNAAEAVCYQLPEAPSIPTSSSTTADSQPAE